MNIKPALDFLRNVSRSSILILILKLILRRQMCSLPKAARISIHL